eukprot:2749778-Amphidinium_carterae.1
MEIRATTTRQRQQRPEFILIRLAVDNEDSKSGYRSFWAQTQGRPHAYHYTICTCVCNILGWLWFVRLFGCAAPIWQSFYESRRRAVAERGVLILEGFRSNAASYAWH